MRKAKSFKSGYPVQCRHISMAIACVIAAVVAVAMPYKNRVDATYRDLVHRLDGEARPDDPWVRFYGLDWLPAIREVMLMSRLAHAAQFHFYLLRDATVSLAWSPDPFADPAATSWRT